MDGFRLDASMPTNSKQEQPEQKNQGQVNGGDRRLLLEKQGIFIEGHFLKLSYWI